MNIIESLRLSLQALLGNKFRASLTILGVIVGTATVIVISSLLTGLNHRVKEMIEEFGTNTIYVARFGFGPRFGDLSEEERKRKTLSKEDGEAIRELSSVHAVSVSLFPDDSDSSPPVVKYGANQANSPNLRGVWSTYLESRGYVLKEGRFFTQTEDDHHVPVCVLAHNVVQALFPNINPLDKEIDIKGEKFRVIGVMEKTKTSFGEDRFEDGLVLTPYNVFRKFYPKQKEHVISVRAKEGQFDLMVDQVTELLRRRRKVPLNAPDNFAINTANSVQESFQSLTASIALLVIPISCFALLVGGIGVMNIMLVSVTERTKEIGIRRAIGARRSSILFQFLVEAIMLTGLGGIMGIIIGELISVGINAFLPNLPSYVPLWSIIVGLLVSVSIGLVSGIWPAFKAAYLDPVEALRYE